MSDRPRFARRDVPAVRAIAFGVVLGIALDLAAAYVLLTLGLPEEWR